MSDNGKIKTNMCEKYPEKCDETSSTYDKCAKDWTACLLDIDFHMCSHFEDACFSAAERFGPQVKEITDFASLKTAVCEFDAETYCAGGSNMNMIAVCRNIGLLDFEILGGTALGSLCE